ncbi:hypothetical protein CCZ27_00895 [Thauera sinica]|nr:hypothetical protein CCZ27_00895 [Thauera sp. K11]
MLPAASVAAAALGEIVSLSAIGEPFRAEIGIASGSAEDLAGCLRVVVPEDAARDLSWLKNGRIGSSGRGASARIVVSSSQPVNEPAIRLALANICDARLRREYTLLLPDPASSPLPAAAHAREAPAAARTGTPAAAASNRATWSTAAGESLASLAGALYPDDVAARRRFTQATAAANPELFPNPASLRAELPPGTAVKIPDLRRLASPRQALSGEAGKRPPVRAQAAAPATQARAAAPAPRPSSPATRNDRVVVAPGGHEAGTPATLAAAGLTPTPRGVHPDASARERELVAAIDRSIVAEMELLSRIKNLEQIHSRLEEQARALAVAAPPLPVAVPDAAQAAEPAPAEARSRSWHDWTLGGGLLLATLLVLAALMRRRTGTAKLPAAQPAVRPSHAAPPQAAGRAGTHAAARSDRGATDETDSRIDWAPVGQRPATSKPSAAGGEHDPSEDHKSAVELAEIMMSFGRLQGAADTLAEFIQGNPRQAITPWLKLLDVYRAAGLRSEFEELSRQLNKTFNVRRVSWDNYDSLRSTSLSLESMPHIAARLEALWGSRECQNYVQQLLRDNRDGSRQGLTFAMIDDLLTLEGILEQELGSYRTYAMKVADTAQPEDGAVRPD